jgi:Xaa-Pro aminopeptidase
VRDYLHVNGITILEYDQVWTSLETLSQVVRAQKKSQEEAKKSGDVEMKEVQVKEDESKDKDKDKDKGEKIVKTDKVLIGNKTSWAVAKAMGEVSSVSQFMSLGRTLTYTGFGRSPKIDG